MTKLEVFDPPMCCSTGICGDDIDPTLVVFASDLEWLKKQGVEVIRLGLSFAPDKFEKNEAVKHTIQTYGNGCLPILVVDNEIVSKACYPSREDLAAMCQIEFNEDEAPPVHREENCCCGIDCDCNLKTHEKFNTSLSSESDESNISEQESCCCGAGCNCSNSPAEDNCCKFDSDSESPKSSENDIFQKILWIGLIVAVVGLVAAKILM